ncbi:hypothetical protein [Actinocorallia libanotica]|uniref:DUF7848 domain-containing protein n=1 Tax=Actinocorallia libanotica TaxID=46162 RepID=A0ABN1RXR7_9ACTN
MMLFSIPHVAETRIPSTFQARCRSGTDRKKCEAVSHLALSSDEVEVWVGAHYKETGHTGYTLVSGYSVNISPHDAGLYPPNQPASTP